MPDFGFRVSKPRNLEPGDEPMPLLEKLEEMEPTFKRCLYCGACTATCSAAQYTGFNIRRLRNLYLWGQYKGLEKELEKCMLCGKCTLVCPRGINLRHLIVSLRTVLNQQA